MRGREQRDTAGLSICGADVLGACRYVGKVPELPLGHWVGVEYDEPVGKNDGSVKGSRYFSAAAGYGGMVRPSNVAVGNFAPAEVEFDDEDEI